MGAAGIWKKIKNFFGKVGDGIGKGLKAIGQLGQKLVDKLPADNILGKAIKYSAGKLADVGVRTGEHLSDISKNGSSKEKWKNYYNDLKNIAPASPFTAPARLIDAIKGGKNGLKNEIQTQINENLNILSGNGTSYKPSGNSGKSSGIGGQLLQQGLQSLLKNKL